MTKIIFKRAGYFQRPTVKPARIPRSNSASSLNPKGDKTTAVFFSAPQKSYLNQIIFCIYQLNNSVNCPTTAAAPGAFVNQLMNDWLNKSATIILVMKNKNDSMSSLTQAKSHLLLFGNGIYCIFSNSEDLHLWLIAKLKIARETFFS